MLDVWNKRTTVEQMKKTIKLCYKTGVIPSGSFIVGGPTETFDDVKKTKKLISETGLEKYGVSLATPFPGTQLWQWCEQNGRIPEKLNWDDFNYSDVPINTSDFSVPELNMLRSYLKQPSLNAMILSALKSPRQATRSIIRNPRKFLSILKFKIRMLFNFVIIPKLRYNHFNEFSQKNLKFAVKAISKRSIKAIGLLLDNKKTIWHLFKKNGVRAAYTFAWTKVFVKEAGPAVINPLFSVFPSLAPYPTQIEVEVTTRCHLKCAFCEHRYWTEKPTDMSFDNFKYLVGQFPRLKWVGFAGIDQTS